MYAFQKVHTWIETDKYFVNSIYKSIWDNSLFGRFYIFLQFFSMFWIPVEILQNAKFYILQNVPGQPTRHLQGPKALERFLQGRQLLSFFSPLLIEDNSSWKDSVSDQSGPHFQRG